VLEEFDFAVDTASDRTMINLVVYRRIGSPDYLGPRKHPPLNIAGQHIKGILEVDVRITNEFLPSKYDCT